MVKFFELIIILELHSWSEPLPLEALKSGIAQKRIDKMDHHFFFLNCVMHLGQYHFPLGFVVRFMQPKWNHSMGQSALSHPIISP